MVAILHTYGDASCETKDTEWMRLRDGALLNSSPKRLGLPLWHYHENAAKEVYVEANKPLHAMIQGGGAVHPMLYRCSVPFSFAFQEGRDYEVYYRWWPNSCSVTIARFENEASGAMVKEVAKFSSQVTNENKGCIEVFRKRPYS